MLAPQCDSCRKMMPTLESISDVWYYVFVAGSEGSTSPRWLLEAQGSSEARRLTSQEAGCVEVRLRPSRTSRRRIAMKKSQSVFDRCVAAYFRSYGRHQDDPPGLYSAPQPSRYDSDWENEDVFALRNCNGVLARYKVTGDEVGGFNVRFIK
jgi:hypothetical protein